MKNDYYTACTRNYETMNHPKAHAHFFANEPRQGEPKHSRALSTAKFSVILGMFVSRLMLDVIINSKYGWFRGTNLPSPNAKIQPLGEQETGTVNF